MDFMDSAHDNHSARVDRGRSDISTVDTRSKQGYVDTSKQLIERATSAATIYQPKPPRQYNGAASARSFMSNFTSVSNRIGNVDQTQEYYRSSPRYSSGIMAATENRTSPRYYRTALDYRPSPRYSMMNNSMDFRRSPRYSTAYPVKENNNSTLRPQPAIRWTEAEPVDNVRCSVEGMADGMRSLSQQMNSMADHMKSMSKLSPLNDENQAPGGFAYKNSPVPSSFSSYKMPTLTPLSTVTNLPSAGRNALLVPPHFARHGSPPRLLETTTKSWQLG